MDPLSVTASVLTLLGAAGTVTKALKNLVQSLKTVDSRLTGLCDELSDLRGYLQAIESTLKGCKQFDLSLVDDGLWQQSEMALLNCRTTLDELRQLVEKIKDASWPRNLGWKIRVMIDLKIHDDDLVAFRDKVQQSNSALQTMLHIIVVSLSLRQNTSQDQILSELHRLKSSINKAWNASSKPIRGSRRRKAMPPESSYRITHNLRHLAAAAESFYTAASSTASTVPSDDGHANIRSPINSQASHRGYFPRPQYEDVEKFLDNLPDRSPATHRAPSSDIGRTRRASLALRPLTPTDTGSIITPIPQEDELYDDQTDLDDDEFLEHLFIDGLRELALTTIKTGDYTRAIQLIKRIVISELGSESGEKGFQEMYCQLILCYFCQGNWRLADPLVKILAETKTTERTVEESLVIQNFSHALALGYLREYSLEEALRYCKQALLGKRKICKKTRANWQEYHETLALFATIYEVSGDCVRAEIYRRQLPRDFIYLHPGSEFEFIQSHKNVLATILGSDDVHLVADNAAAGDQATSPTTAQESSLRLKLSQHGRDELDTDKIHYVPPPNSPAYEADEELSPGATSPSHPRHRPLRRQLTRFFKPGHHRYNAADSGGEYGSSDAESPSVNDSFPKVSPFRKLFNRAPLLKSRRRKTFQLAMATECQDSVQCNWGIESLHTPKAELYDTSRMELDDTWPTEATASNPTAIPLPAELDATGPVHIGRLSARVHLEYQPSQAPNQLPQPSSQRLPEELESITHQVTKLFALLNENGDLASLEEQERRLTALLPRFEALSWDKAVVSDARVAMLCLRKKIAARYMAQEDSGYESTQSLGTASSSSIAPENIPLSPFPQQPSHDTPVKKEEALSIRLPKVGRWPPLPVTNSYSSSSGTAKECDVSLASTDETQISYANNSDLVVEGDKLGGKHLPP